MKDRQAKAGGMGTFGRLLLMVIGALAVTLLGVVEADARRVALVIGNAAYASAAKLGSPAKDAEAVEAALKRLKFDDVIRLTDLGVKPMADALTRFRRAAVGADVALVYFSGHGIEIEGVNYLVPTDATLDDPGDAGLQAIALTSVMRQLDGVRGLRMIILDACRDNPFQQRLASMPGAKSAATRKGFAAVPEADLGQRTVVAFAAREGTTAEDRPGRLSTYTEALLRHMEQPGLELRLLLGSVRDDVIRDSGGRQRPHEYASLGGAPLYLAPPKALQGPREPVSSVAIEWRDVKDSGNRRALEGFLARHKSDPVYAPLAEQAIAALQPPPAAPLPRPQPAPVVAAPRCTGVEVDVVGRGKQCLDPADTSRREFEDCVTTSKGTRLCMPMVMLPKGTYKRGSEDGDADEKPVSEVTIGYHLGVGKHEVTRGQFAAFVAATGPGCVKTYADLRDERRACYSAAMNRWGQHGRVRGRY